MYGFSRQFVKFPGLLNFGPPKIPPGVGHNLFR